MVVAIYATALLVFLTAVCLAAAWSRHRNNNREPHQQLFKDPVFSPKERMWFLLEREVFQVEEHVTWLRQLKDKFVLALKDLHQAQENISRTQSTREWGGQFFDAQERLIEASGIAWLELPGACVDACTVELVNAYKKATRFHLQSLARKQTVKAMDSLLLEVAALIAQVKTLNDTATPLRALFPSTGLKHR
jgi:hypothetical protein